MGLNKKDIMKTPEERILSDCVSLPPDYTFYTESGKDFKRFRDKETGKLFEIKVKEVKQKPKN